MKPNIVKIFWAKSLFLHGQDPTGMNVNKKKSFLKFEVESSQEFDQDQQSSFWSTL